MGLQMKVKEFFDWADEQHKIEMKIMKGKGREYTMNDVDKLKNFKFIAERLKDKPEKIAMVYLLKHMDSITNYVLEGIEASDESIEGRFHDVRNYALLLHAIIKENKEQKEDEWVKENNNGYINYINLRSQEAPGVYLRYADWNINWKTILNNKNIKDNRGVSFSGNNIRQNQKGNYQRERRE